MKEEWKAAARERIQNMGIDEAAASSSSDTSATATSADSAQDGAEPEEDGDAVVATTGSDIVAPSATPNLSGSSENSTSEDTPQVLLHFRVIFFMIMPSGLS